MSPTFLSSRSIKEKAVLFYWCLFLNGVSKYRCCQIWLQSAINFNGMHLLDQYFISFSITLYEAILQFILNFDMCAIIFYVTYIIAHLS